MIGDGRLRYLIFGGMGFMGFNLTRELIQEGHEIIVFDRVCLEERKIGGCQYVVDEFKNLKEHPEIFRQIDGVYHLVHSTTPKTSNDDPIYDIESNVIGTIQLLDLCISNGIKKLIFISSGGTVYGIPQYLPIREIHPTNPICSYGISKLTIEKYLELYSVLYGLEYVIVRLSNPYGPYQSNRAQGIIGVLIDKIFSSRNIEIWGDGSIVRDYIYIRDVIDVFKILMTNSNENKIYNVGSGRGQSIKDLVNMVQQITGKNFNITYKDNRAFDVSSNILDIGRITQEYSWQPCYDIESGIRDFILWKQREG